LEGGSVIRDERFNRLSLFLVESLPMYSPGRLPAAHAGNLAPLMLYRTRRE
jgi:hypothetical protein